MDRRNFLALLGATVAVPLLPKGVALAAPCRLYVDGCEVYSGEAKGDRLLSFYAKRTGADEFHVSEMMAWMDNLSLDDRVCAIIDHAIPHDGQWHHILLVA